jgi:Arc/MetJ-type ribon-helix-helix transcriptional regulator
MIVGHREVVVDDPFLQYRLIEAVSGGISSMGSAARKVTFSLREDLLVALDQAVARGTAPSKSAFVERALRKELQEIWRQEREALWQEASRDPLFLRDLAETAQAFARADEGLARDTR